MINAVSQKLLTVLIGWDSDLTAAELADLGVRRISLGGALARTAWDGFIKAASAIAESGDFHSLNTSVSSGDLNSRFK